MSGSLADVVEENGLRWYLIDGKRIPSVTSVLGWCCHHPDWARYDLTSPAVVHARNKGRAIHTACYWIAKGRRLNPETVDSELEPYIAQFEGFLAETRFQTMEAEFLVSSQKYRYAGRGDLWGKMPDVDRGNHLIDIKSGVVQVDMAGWQTAAYLRACREGWLQHEPCKRSVLHLDGGKPDGWRLVALNGPDDWAVFLSALNVFKAATNRGML